MPVDGSLDNEGMSKAGPQLAPLAGRLLADKRLIAFDLDGTLIDSVPDLALAVQGMLAEQGLTVPGEERVRDWVGNGAAVLVTRALGWSLGHCPDTALHTDSLTRFLRHYAATGHRLSMLYPGAYQLVHDLHQAGFVLALITNKPQAFIAPILEHFGLQGAFSITLGGDSLSHKKPDPLPLLEACRLTGLVPSDAVMIGDSRHDVAAGRAAGFTTIGLEGGYNHGDPIDASKPDWVLASLTQLLHEGPSSA